MQVISGRFIGSRGVKELEAMIDGITGEYTVGDIEIVSLDGGPTLDRAWATQYVTDAIRNKLGYAQNPQR